MKKRFNLKGFVEDCLNRDPSMTAKDLAAFLKKKGHRISVKEIQLLGEQYMRTRKVSKAKTFW